MSRRSIPLDAYAAAEDRLLDIISPPATTDNAADAVPVAIASGSRSLGHLDLGTSAGAVSPGLQLRLNPSVDSVLHVISDNSEIHDLVSRGDDFKGFEDEWTGNDGTPVSGQFIYGVCRTRRHLEPDSTTSVPAEGPSCSASSSSMAFVECSPSKQPRLVQDNEESDGQEEEVSMQNDYEAAEVRVPPPTAFMEHQAPGEPNGFSYAVEGEETMRPMLPNGDSDNGNKAEEEMEAEAELDTEDAAQESFDNDIEIIVRSDDEDLDNLGAPQTSTSNCIIYDDIEEENAPEDNLVVLSDDHACEIIVSGDQGLAHAFMNASMLHLMPEQVAEAVMVEEGEPQLNGDAHNVYLSDAALVQQEHQLYVVGDDEIYAEEQEEQQEAVEVDHQDVVVVGDTEETSEPPLVCFDDVDEVDSDEDPNNENDAFVDDTRIEEEHPDICPVFDHELEEHDQEDSDEEIDEKMMYAQDMRQVAGDWAAEEVDEEEMELQEPATPLDIQPTIVIDSDGDNEVEGVGNDGDNRVPVPVMPTTLSWRDHSTTTEFPVSSTSRPNGSDYDDYEDELGEDQQQGSLMYAPPAPRKYPPLLKNTLSAEALDRKLATICQTQPQMSVSEKVANWDCAEDCDAVEDVENFESVFEQHEATRLDVEDDEEDEGSPRREHNFNEFCDALTTKLSRITSDVLQGDQPEAQNSGVFEDAEIIAERILQRRQSELPKHSTVSELTLGKRKMVCDSYKRLLNAVHGPPPPPPPPVQSHPRKERSQAMEQVSEGLIVLDDDDEDCFEIMNSASQLREASSVTTLVPQEDHPEEIITKTAHTQTPRLAQTPPSTQPAPAVALLKLPTTQSKETSTTDLDHHLPPSNATSSHFADVVWNVMREQAQQAQQRSQSKSPPPTPRIHQRSTSTTARPDEQFYQQHEFCNYLGLTELATANAVATAMRELANSTVARRSLRVRTQQQLDRMRGDVRGRRKERQRQQQQQQQEPLQEDAPTINSGEQTTSMDNIKLMTNADKENSANSMSELEGNSTTRPLRRVTESDLDYRQMSPNPQHHHYKQPSHAFEPRKSAQLYDYYCNRSNMEKFHDSTSSTQLEPSVETSYMDSTYFKDSSLVPQVSSCEPPVQETHLHESMQQRLKLARETKPSIYIVQAYNNDKPRAPSAATSEHFGNLRVPCPSLSDSTHQAIKSTAVTTVPPTSANTPYLVPRVAKKPSPKSTEQKRRKTTHGVVEAPVQRKVRKATQIPVHVRELVTRSTTHMNSKLLRNRKVSLLKTYALTDNVSASYSAGTGRKQRLSGGTTGNKQPQTPKAVKVVKAVRTNAKASLKKAVDKAAPSLSPTQLNPQLAPVQREVRTVIIDRKELMEATKGPEQHRLHQQQQSPNSPHVTSPKGKNTRKNRKSPGGLATAVRALERQVNLAKSPAKGNAKAKKRTRAKSEPVPAPTNKPEEDIDYPVEVPKKGHLEPPQEPVPPKRDLSYAPNTQEFITNHAVVRPPLYGPAARRFVNNVRKCVEQAETAASPYQDPSALHSPFNFLSKPAMIYPTRQAQQPHFSRRRESAGTAVIPEPVIPDISTAPPGSLFRLTTGSPVLRNPLAGKHGKVLYMYYELEQLIVLQEKIITFWKYSKLFNVLQKTTDATVNQTAESEQSFEGGADSANADGSTDGQRWVHLGRARRITNDFEITTPFGNRLCLHNSTPVYIEMRSHTLDHHKREGKLLSLYVNVYYYCEEEMRPKMHSVHLDAVNCESHHVIYTTITESRYFVMAWQQEHVMSKTRSGICKYSLTPTLDTLASIREFKQLRHELKYIECLTEDRLIGYGSTRVTIWDHRSGDTLMNYDLGFDLGTNLGAMHFPSFDMGQCSLLLLFQHTKPPNKSHSDLRIIACELSHATPSHRILHLHRLPSPQFDSNIVSINTGDHLILKARTEDEIWISAADPRLLTYVAPLGQGTQRFYSRHKSQVIELAQSTLTVDCIANHMLKLATQHQQKIDRPSTESSRHKESISSPPHFNCVN